MCRRPPPASLGPGFALRRRAARAVVLALAALTLLALIADAAQAASDDGRSTDGRARVGVRVGVHAATLYGDDAEGARPRLGLSAGVFVRVPLTPRVGVQIEALYTEKGARFDVAGETLAYTSGYAELPVLVRAEVGGGDRLRPYLIAGPALAVKLTGAFADEALAGGLASGDLALVAGGGVEVRVGRRRLALDLRATLGLQDVFTIEADPEAKHAALTASVGFTL